MRFRKHLAPIRVLRCRPDVVFTRHKLVVFVDGCFWHRCPQHGVSPKTNSPYWQAKLDANVRRDRRNTEAFEQAGWTVLRFWEHQPPDDIADEVEETLAGLTGAGQ